MSAPPVDLEMQRRFDSAEKTRIHESSLARPALAPSPESLRAHFASDIGRAAEELQNPHLEPRVTDEERAKAVPASVLLAIVLREDGPKLIVTQRDRAISFPGHWVFPGGRADDSDADPIATALREAEEEIGLDPARVEVLGRLGDYVSHSGFRVAPTVALVEPPIELRAQPGEVAAIDEIPLSRFFDPRSYFLFRFKERPNRAHFAMETDQTNILLTGVTCSIAIGFYGELAKTHPGE